jgi:hypothetical protein
VPVHISAWADHHIKTARVSVKGLPTLRITSSRNRETAYLRTGYPGLGGVTSPCLLRYVMAGVMFRGGLR